MIALKRAYEAAAAGDGRRILVERLWPRGVKKTDLPLDGWMKEVAPSTELRQWFSHDPAKWVEFQKRYLAELRAHAAAVQPLLDAAARRGKLTLIYSSHDEEHNNAVVLKRFLEDRLKKKGKAA
jgi:uncharacterized protein YeaO (DUF488 family)